MKTVYRESVATPIGRLTLLSSDRGLCYVELPGSPKAEIDRFVTRHFPDAKVAPGGRHNRKAASQIKAYLSGKIKRFTVPLDLKAEGFSRKALLKVKAIPHGKTRTYGQIAASLGNPKAARAVGAANASNPIPIIIPCHRVVGAAGLGGYGGGLSLKKKLLLAEGAIAK
jgi:O-6-methylguanine DNA methyltransferase